MYTNYGNVSLALAVWLASDDGYDLKYHPTTVSATTLLQPVRSVVLTRRLKADQKEGTIDISDLVPSRLGTAVHTAAEVAWLDGREKALANLGIPQNVIDKIKLNPDTPSEDPTFDIYLENRVSRKLGEWTISGKYDFVEGGRVKDIKTTKVYNWVKGSNDSKYMQQGSIYRWLNPEIITDDFVDIEMLFTDWNPLKAQIDKTYPPKRIMTRTLELMTLDETQDFVQTALNRIIDNLDKPQEELPRCTPEELWMDPPKWAYYKNPNNTARATKLFDTEGDAYSRRAEDGGVGMVVKREMEPTFCKYCSARPICVQAEEYIEAGILQL